MGSLFGSLRARIVVFFVTLLAVVQLVDLLLVNAANTANAMVKIEEELRTGERVFSRLLARGQERLTDTARVLAADYGFREAVGTRDISTVLSALRNHGARIDADLSQLLALDGRVLADTGEAQTTGADFAFEGLLARARRDGRAAGIELIDEHAYQLVIVPIPAPLTIGWLVMGFRVDDALAAELREITGLDVSFALTSLEGSDHRLLASTLTTDLYGELAGALPVLAERSEGPRVVRLAEHDFQLQSMLLGAYGDTALVAILQRSMSSALSAFDRLRQTLVWVGAFSLGASLLGSLLLAAGVTRPLAKLVRAAVRIEEGDYQAPVGIRRRDEIGVLAHSIDHMREAVASREREILRLAYRDPLTSLPNRSSFNEALEQAITSGRAGDVTILVMDLDRFKDINDTLGHDLGDHVLREVTARLKRGLDQGDVVARLGGDEFALLMRATGSRRVDVVARDINRRLEEPIWFGGQPVDVGVSIGIARHPEHGEDAPTLIRNADVAMYVAKRNRSGFAEYDPDTDTNRRAHLSMLSELRQAIDGNELQLYYQPKVSLQNESTRSVEALIRWIHPKRGVIPPSMFIPFAENTGYIKTLTRWALEAALRQIAVWRRHDLNLQVAVNISARDLTNPDLPQIVYELLSAYGVPPRLLCLEITESGFMNDPKLANKILYELSQMGVRLAIDDYGTGYSSLSYIMRLPVNELKIDQAFVRGMRRDRSAATIVKSTVELGHNLGLSVVAEGVEDERGWDELLELGCDYAQGFYLSPPLCADDLAVWLKSRRSQRAQRSLQRVGPAPEDGARSA